MILKTTLDGKLLMKPCIRQDNVMLTTKKITNRDTISNITEKNKE